MKRAGQTIAVVLLVVGWCAGVGAQPRLIISGQGPSSAGSPSSTMSVDLATYAVEWSSATSWIQPTVTADGRYLVAPVASGSPPAGALLVRDLSSGFVTTIPLGASTPKSIKAHPRRLEVFAMMTDGTVTSITTAGMREMFRCESPNEFDISGDGSRLALVCGSDIVVLCADHGTLIARIPAASYRPGTPVANFDGSRVLAEVSGNYQVLAVWDVATQTVVAGMPATADTINRRIIASTPDRNEVLVGTSWSWVPGLSGYKAWLVDFTTLRVRQTLANPGNYCKSGTDIPCWAPRSAAFTPDGRHVVLGWIDPWERWTGVVQIVDVEANRVVASSGPGFFASAGVSLALASVPLAPTNLLAQVSGGNVTLSWDPAPTSPAVTGYVVEAGSAPGLANLAALSVAGDQRSLSVTSVPPGRYFVRVRAVNVTGRGNPSADIVVEVM